MKGIAILAMLCHHLYGCPPDGVDPYTGVLLWLGILGKVCVVMFLFCSGYGLAANFAPKSFKDDLKFIGRRLVKFYLNYWVIFIIFVPITIFFFYRPLSAAYGENNVCWHLVLDILAFQGLESYNITWWFNNTIIILYLLFPLLYRAIRWKPLVALLVGMVIMRIAYHLPYNPADVLTWQFPFILGIIWRMYEGKGACVQDWFSAHRGGSVLGVLGLLAIIIVFRMWEIIPHFSGARMDGFLSCAIALCVIVILRSCKYLMATFAFFGKHSMNIYMVHTFINGYWYSKWLHSDEWIRGGANFAVLLSICVVISIVVEFFKEKAGIYQLIRRINNKIQ